MKRKGSNLFFNTILLSLSSMIIRVIQIVYKVFVSNEIGSEGLGLSKLIGTVTMVAMTIATSGIATAVTRIVSEQVSKRNYTNVKYLILKACTISAVLGLISSSILIGFSDEIALYIFKDSRIILTLKIIAISIPLISVSSCIRGYFYAVRDIFVPITCQFIEKFIQIAVVVAFLSIGMSKGLEYGLAVLALGNVVKEIVSFIYIVLSYFLEKRENENFKRESKLSDGLIKEMFKVAMPIAASSYSMSIFKSIEMTLIPVCLIAFGMSKSEAVSIIGGVMGMVFPIIMFPMSLLMSLVRVLMPEIARAKAVNNRERVNSLISRSIGFTSVLGIITALVIYSFNNELGVAIYSSNDIGMYFKMIAISIPFMYIDGIMSGILNGLNEQLKSFQYLIMESILRVICIYLLLPIKGVEGLMMTMFIAAVFSCTLSALRVKKVTEVKMQGMNWIIKPLIFGILAVEVSKIFWTVKVGATISLGISLTIGIILVLAIYFILIKLFKCIKIRD